MYQINSKVWAIINKFDSPKEVTIEDVFYSAGNTVNTVVNYNVKYKNRLFEVSNVDIYPTQIDADIYWSTFVMEDYQQTLNYPDLFSTDEYEIANCKAEKIIKKYAESHPHLILKYF